MKRWHLTEQPFADGLTQAVFEYLSAKGDRSTLTGYSAHPPFARADLAEALDDLAQAAGEAARELRGEGGKEPEQPDPDGPRPLTVEEVREKFLDHVVAMAKYWSRQPKNSELERCLGLAHSLLATISGRAAGLPGFDLICSPHPDDEQYHRNNGENWFPAEDINDGDLNRHLYWRPDGSRRPGTEGDANQEQPDADTEYSRGVAHGLAMTEELKKVDSVVRAPDATPDTFAIEEELKHGGAWLGAAREWLTWKVSDRLKWASAEPVTLAFNKFEELALRVAAAAVSKERQERARESVQLREVWEGQRAQKEQSDVAARVATIADEAFGPFPVQSVEENLTAIERGIFEARTENERLRSALEFYANPMTYAVCGTPKGDNLSRDHDEQGPGKRARESLEKTNE